MKSSPVLPAAAKAFGLQVTTIFLAGIAVRAWQLGIEMRPLLHNMWAYPTFASVGAGFGYYLEGLTQRHRGILEDQKERLLEKRKRRDEKERLRGVEGQTDGAVGEEVSKDGVPVIRGTAWGK